MRVRIDHGQCQHGPGASEACLARVLRNPRVLEPGCAAQMEDDGRIELTVTLVLDGKDHTLVLHNPHEIDFAAADGSAAFRRGRLAKIGP